MANDLLDESVTRSFSHGLDDVSSYVHMHLSDIKYNSYHPNNCSRQAFSYKNRENSSFKTTATFENNIYHLL